MKRNSDRKQASVFGLLSGVALAAALAGCDAIGDRRNDAERADGLYRTAMADYTAGRLDQAVAGFEKVIRANPANANARFQLACLQQEQTHDYLGAVCNYREFLLQMPKSDRAPMAVDRLAACERLLATALAKKLKLFESGTALEEANAHLREDVARLEKELAAAKGETAKARGETASVQRDVARLTKLLKGIGEDADKTHRRLTDEELVDVTAAEDDEVDDRIKTSADIAALRADEAAERADSATPFAPMARKPEEAKPDETKRTVPPHPATYTVQEGDTLYQIAIRFYHTRMAWKVIREANKALIPMDGRVKAGDVIRLP